MYNSIDRNYPGEFIDRLMNSDRYPIPCKVGEYTSSLDEYISMPKTMAQWVHFRSRSNLVIEGRYEDIKPVHFDGTFTLACNLRCPHCTARPARARWVSESTWKSKFEISEKNTMPFDKILYAIEQIASFKVDDHMGISWNGGEPSIIPNIYQCIDYARKKGIKSCFLTNGVNLDPEGIIKTHPNIVRISLNCGNVEDYTVFHGCKKREDNFKKVLRNIEKIAELKKSLGIDILFGVSLLIDERNINGLTQAIDILINIQKNNPYAIDNILVRPVMKFEHFEKNYAVKNSDTNKNIIEKLVNSANYYEKCKDVDIKLITRGDWYEPRPSLNEYGGDKCLSYGWFSQIMYNGNIQLCSESFCDPKFTIGNIFENSINDIWQSERRKELIDKINKEKCFVGKCQHNSRGHQLNRIFNQIEKMRKDGKMAIVKKWIKDLRKMTVPPYHSFFM